MTRPKVLFVSAVPDFKGGAEVVLCSMLANPHIEPILAVPEQGPVAEAARAMGVPVCTYDPVAMLHVHRPPRLRPILAAAMDAVRCAFRLRRLAREYDCSILHSNGLKPHMLCAILGRSSRLHTVVHLHDIPYRLSERAIWRGLVHRVCRVIMVSRPCFPGERLPSNVQVVPNGVTPVYDELPPARAPGPLRLGFVGRFHPNKGMDVLLDWFKAVREAGLDATLSIRGRPDPDMPEYWDRIIARIRDEGLTGFVRHEGWVTGRDTYSGLDILLVTSKMPDPAPLVVLEAMSAGVVVAGYPKGGIPWMIEDGRTGLLTEDGKVLARRLRALLDEPDGLERLRHAAFTKIQTEHSLRQFHAHLFEVYRQVLHQPGHGALKHPDVQRQEPLAS